MAAGQKRKENLNKGGPLCMYVFEFLSCQHCQTETECGTLYSELYVFHSYWNSSERWGFFENGSVLMFVKKQSRE